MKTRSVAAGLIAADMLETACSVHTHACTCACLISVTCSDSAGEGAVAGAEGAVEGATVTGAEGETV